MIGNAFGTRVLGEILLGAVGERTDHHVVAVVAEQLRGHRLQLAVEEHVEEQRLDDVVAMVAERDPGGADLAREAVEIAAAQARAEPAGGLALGDHRLHDAVGVALEDVELDAEPDSR
jgi:hypothetical protein